MTSEPGSPLGVGIVGLSARWTRLILGPVGASAPARSELPGRTHEVPDFAHGVRRRELITAIERSAITGARVHV